MFTTEFEYKDSKVIVVPVPYEKTTSYGKGTKNGPSAIIEASYQTELYDEELKSEPYKIGICNIEPVNSLAALEDKTGKILKDKKFPLLLGGEHTISIAPIKAVRKFYPDLSVVQVDAHADLRDEYEGTKDSHACVMRRVFEAGVPFIQVGIRNHSVEEADLLEKNSLKPFYAHEIHSSNDWMDGAIEKLNKNVYLTFDVDAFDPSLIPGTGTPEPGGLGWYQVVEFLKRLTAKRNIVGADFVELAPIKGEHRSEFTIAKLIYKFIGYIKS